jgi:hypothetical protein
MVDTPIDSQNNEAVVVQNGISYKRSIAHLPAFYRTDVNERFLSSTLDQLIQPGKLERLDGYIGRKDAHTAVAQDYYLQSKLQSRNDYQLEPTVTYTQKDTSSITPEDQVKFTATYDDYINQIKFLGGTVDNHDRLNKEKVYAWDPGIDFDKLVNYREYYWLPEGLNPILINNSGPTTVSEIVVSHSAQRSYNFSNYLGMENPSITLYRGNTYKFIIDTPGHPMSIMTEPFTTGIAEDDSTSVLYSTGVSNNGAEQGILTFTVPTNAPDVLYYQCALHSEMHGIFTIRTITDLNDINVIHEITGTKNYTLASGTALSNGMKIQFPSNVTNKDYANKQFYVEGVGTSITLTKTTDLIVSGTYAEESTEPYDGVSYADRPYSVSSYRPVEKDYITIKRDSVDGNAWSAYNRWFHKATIESTATALGYTPNLLETDRAKRPIIEFDSGLSLYNHGTVSKPPVTLVDDITTDVFSKLVNQSGYIVDGVPLREGMRLLVLADSDPLVNNRVYLVNFVSVAGQDVTTVKLTQDFDGLPADGDSVTVQLGAKYQGKTWYFDQDQNTWVLGQSKTSVNQSPLFNLFDANHKAFDDVTAYPNSTFTGSKLFEYKTSDLSPVDAVLGLQIKYNSIKNVGDIVFTSDYATDYFEYLEDGKRLTKNLNTGHYHQVLARNTHISKYGWVEQSAESQQRSVRSFIVTDQETRLFPIDAFSHSKLLSDLTVVIEVNHTGKNLITDYTLVDGVSTKYVRFNADLKVGDIVKVTAYSSATKVANKGLYEIPENLAVNPFNSPLGDFTYGQIQNHLVDINEKNSQIVGKTPGSSNLRDLGDIKTKGGTIIQHGSTLPQAMFLLIDSKANAIRALEYCSTEYQKFKETFLTNKGGTTQEGTVPSRVDEILKLMNSNKDKSFPFYYDDMLGYGETVKTRTYTVQSNEQIEYAIESNFSVTALSNRAVYIYLNGVQLVLGYDYTFSTTFDGVTITTPLVEGDIITINDYNETEGSFVPPTPTKLGLYPKFKPELVTDNTYRTVINVIVGHDGSRTIAFGDYRDDLLLELEKRIYNNCKTHYKPELLSADDVTPGIFRNTEYTRKEINNILSLDFYGWSGAHGVNYEEHHDYNETDQFTFNYSTNNNIISNEKLAGHWRAIYKHLYDTDRPHTNPWEMLGYSEKPIWWEASYGPAPYTAGNTLLWNDLSVGFDAGLKKAVLKYRRTGLLNYIPVDDSGNLKSPIEIGIVKQYENVGLQNKWKFGDHGPAETAWRRSSQYPFAVMKLLALTKPAKFFGYFLDNSRLGTNLAGNIINTDTGLAPTLASSTFYLDTSNRTSGHNRTAGYQPFIVNYLIRDGLDPAVYFYDKLKNLNVQLAYKLGGFTDKDNIKVLTDSISPGSTAGSQFIPEENYKLLFRSSNPVETFEYSGVLIELNSATTNDGSTIEGGYKVVGYNTHKPYFRVFSPIQNSASYNINAGNSKAVIYKNWSSTETVVTYGTVFKTVQSVVDFLIGYGKYLESRGFTFDKFSGELKEVQNWEMTAKEFLYWTRQGWSPGSAITLSPAASGFVLETTDSIISKFENLFGQYSILDSTGTPIESQFISTKRIGNKFSLSVKNTESGIYNISMNAVQKEHMIIFDNITVFSDIIYQLTTGFRQQRLKLIGWKTADWNGDYYSPGFVFDEAKVDRWTANTDYNIGNTVEYGNYFYVAKENHNSGAVFGFEKWTKKSNKPAARLIPNFDYKISQFNDFYALETNNFDEGQQRLAQHLIGYQSRPYLDNLFQNDISQYKFYQGFIREKGTLNSIEKLVKAKFYGENITLNTYPEWMIKVGEFGNVDKSKSIQLVMPEKDFTNTVNSIELLTDENSKKQYSRSSTVYQDELFGKPVEYTAGATFKTYDYTQQGVDRDVVQTYKTAGYPRLIDTQHTALNIQDLLNLNVTAIRNSDLIWIAKKENTDWDVQRITYKGLTLRSYESINDGTQTEFTFNNNHELSVGQYIAIVNSQYPELNRVYRVSKISTGDSVIVDASGLPIRNTDLLADQSTVSTYGNLYTFVSVRLSTLNDTNNILPYDQYKVADEVNGVPGDKLFVDNIGSTWKIYEKIDPYTLTALSSGDFESNQEFGHQMVSTQNGRYLIVSAPGNRNNISEGVSASSQGTIYFFTRPNVGSSYKLINSHTMTDSTPGTGRLGESMSMSTDENFVIAGAPYANSLFDDNTRYNSAGLVYMYSWNTSVRSYQEFTKLIAPSWDSTSREGHNFGWAHALAEPAVTSTLQTPQKYLLISAPGYNDDTGTVYAYTYDPAYSSASAAWVPAGTINSQSPGTSKRFGHKMSINDNGDILAISSTSVGDGGKVEIFTRGGNNDGSTANTWIHRQTLKGVVSEDSTVNTSFGDSVSMSDDGTTLVIGAPGVDVGIQDDAGAIYIYKWDINEDSTQSYTLDQTLLAPNTQTNMQFGSTTHLNKDATRIVIGARAYANSRDIKFDNGSTTFDLTDTQIIDSNIGSGGVFTATKYNDKFLLDQKLVTTQTSSNDNFGRGVFVVNDTVYVGAPGDDTVVSNNSTRKNDGMVAVFDLKKSGEYAWKTVAQETPLMDDKLINSAFVFNTATQKIIGYLDYYDPIKGRILGIADREINYKTEWDPAVYDVGTLAVTVQAGQSWGEEHVGEVWWDLSSARWIWYEQGDQEYKTKQWGKLFPGSTIDVYEWVETTLTPLQWASNADTPQGLTNNISGTPRNTNNTVYSIRQKYNSRSDSFVNYYYYWVKNSVFIPDAGRSVVSRKNTTAYISKIITNPLASGLRYFTVTDVNKLITFNINNDLINGNTVLNVTYQDNKKDGDVHYVWKLLREGDKDSRPNSDVENKWWDSLAGADTAGNQVPDVTVPMSQRYGTSIRPRQSWYTNRFEALKEIIDYSNSVLIKYQLANSIRYDNLNAEELEPNFVSGEWDETVNTYADLTYIDTRDISGTLNVLIHNDEKYSNNFWAIYQWNGVAWSRIKVQTYKTNAYYETVDWYDTSFDSNKIIAKQIQYQYQLELTDVVVTEYVKVLTSDTGGWKIFEKTSTGFVNIATQNGTIRLNTSLYDYGLTNIGFAGLDAYDTNFFDGEPQFELRSILKALRDDIFINELSIEYNNIFFIGVRKVLEQLTYTDWLSKTAFISVSNKLRELDQRTSYRANTENYVEEYINEVKPFHTKVREYRLGYDTTDTQDGIFTDFDLPALYDGTTIRNINLETDTHILNTYPYRFWKDNYKKYVTSIDVVDGGSGYTTAPTVTLVGGTTKSVGPFTVLGSSTQGSTNGTYGYFYPLYTAEIDSNVADGRAGGSNTSEVFVFSEFPGITFYMPTTVQNTANVNRPSGYDIYTTTDVDQATATAVVRSGSVVKITLLTNGSNYTATPTVVLTGGRENGVTPADTARAYANLKNDVVRDINTTIKFDRVQSTATVITWTVNTSYAYNDLLRYEDAFYKVNNSYVSTAKFDEGLPNLTKLRGDEPYITAAERTLGFYTPTTGMAGNELSQLMTGVDYGGVTVTGLAFNNSQGWDASPWYELPWDSYGSNIVKVFYGDGSTTGFTFDQAPTALDVYTVYFTDISGAVASKPIATATVNRKRQTSQVIRGDGSTTTFTIVGDNNSPASANTLIELIPFESDGVATPTDEKTLDSLISGGLFKSALGIAPSDIILEGDTFISPETSYAPEENLPGSVFDTLDIKIYQTPDSGVPFITAKNYTANGSNATYSMGATPGTLASIMVSIDGVTQRVTADYTVNVSDQTITFTTVPSVNSIISIKIFSISGTNFMVSNLQEGDGSTLTFETDARETYQFDSSLSQLFVTVDGAPNTAFTHSTEGKNIKLTFSNPPADGAVIQIASFNQPPGNKAVTEIRSEQIIWDGSSLVYPLTYPAGAIGPYSSFTLLEHNGKILRGPDNTYYSGDGSTSSFSFLGYAGAVVADSTLLGYRDILLGDTKNIINAPTTIDSFATSLYDSAWYFAITLDEISGELATAKYSLVQNNTNAYVSTSSITQTGNSNHITVDGTIESGTTVKLLGTGASTLNSASWYRIGLGDTTTTDTVDTNASTLVVPTVTSSGTVLDSYSKTDYRSSKYFVSANEIGTTNYTNAEILVTNNGTEVSMSVYNIVNIGSTIINITADMVGTNVVLTGEATSGNVKVNMYRIAIEDNQVGNGTTRIGATAVDSSLTQLDTFLSSSYSGAHYVVSAWNPTEGASSVYEVTVTGKNGSAYISTAGVHSKDSTQLTFDASLNSNVVSLNVASTSGAGTVVNAYRIGLLTTPGGAVIDPSKVRVYVNSQKQELYSDFTVDIDAKLVTLNIAPVDTALVVISTIVGAHYYDDNDQLVIHPDSIAQSGINLQIGDVLNATTFNNSAGMIQRRESFIGSALGEYELFESPLNTDHMFVWLNGNSLVQGYDWTLSDGSKLIIPNKTLTASDRIDAMYFAVPSGISNAVGYRIFKDMLNRTFYKRLSQPNTTNLTRELLVTDTTIYVENGDLLTPVDGDTQLPGVVFIGRERIEYFNKSGNTLSKIRRGTLGTSIFPHAVRARVQDASGAQTVPYADTTYTKKHTADGSTTAFMSAVSATTPYELDVFVGGTRLPYLNEDSSANYTVSVWDDSSANVTLANAPSSGIEVKIIQKKGKIWYNPGNGTSADGQGFGKSTTAQASFIKQVRPIQLGRPGTQPE